MHVLIYVYSCIYSKRSRYLVNRIWDEHMRILDSIPSKVCSSARVTLHSEGKTDSFPGNLKSLPKL